MQATPPLAPVKWAVFDIRRPLKTVRVVTAKTWFGACEAGADALRVADICNVWALVLPDGAEALDVVRAECERRARVKAGGVAA